MKAALASLTVVAAFVALIHCGDDKGNPIECSVASGGKSCDCTPGRETLGFCSEQVLGIPSVCCAQDGWPKSGSHCMCELIVCVSIPSQGSCKCSRATQRLQGAADAEEVAECPAMTSDATRCCVDAAGNCGCYLKTNDQCGEGATDVDKCDYFKAKPPCAATERATTTCEQ